MVAWLALQGGIGGAILLGDYIYHRLTEPNPKPDPAREVTIPHAEIGAPVPLVFGRVRVRRPILVWHSTPQWVDPSFAMDMLFVLGVPMDDGNGTSRMHAAWAGDAPIIYTDSPPTSTGDGGPEGVISLIGTGRNGENLGIGFVEFLNGADDQVVVNDGETTSNASTWLGRSMLASTGLSSGGGLTEDEISGYRGYMLAYLYRDAGGDNSFLFGANPSPPAYSFEVSSYQTGNSFPGTGIIGQIGRDSNPANVIYCLLQSKHAKAGLDAATYIDADSFSAAAATLHQESHGYSKLIDNRQTLDEHIQEILRQIDGVLYADETDSKYKLKLIRPDYVIRDLPVINKDNAIDLVNFSIGGWSDIANRVKVVYTNSDDSYNEDSESAQSSAAQFEGLINEVVLNMPSITHRALAATVAHRELAARARPLMKCRAILDRSFVRLVPGDAVLVQWSEPDISNLVFRVAAPPDRGTLTDGRIQVDLIQDFAYTHRQISPLPPGLDRGSLGPGGFDLLGL